jgi:hypothetical protein
MENIPDLPDAANFMVGIGVRIVPAGIDDDVVRASLILSPVAADSTAAVCGKKIDIRQWPQRIEAILQDADAADSTNLSIVLSPVVAGDKLAQPVDPGTLAQMHATRAMFYDQPAKDKITDPKKWRDRRDADVTQIVEIWQRLIAAPDRPDWKRIVDALKEKGAGAQLDNIISKATPGPPDIRGVGRGQAALLLSLERGRSLLARTNLLLNGASCVGREEECNLAAPLAIRRKSYLTTAERKANGEEGSETRRKAEEAAFQAYENGTELERLDKELQLLDDDINQRRLVAIAAQQQKKETRDKLTGADTPSAGRVEAYQKLLECASSDSVAECFAAVTRLDAQPLQNAVGGSVDRHNDAVREEDVVGRQDPNRPADLEADHNARQALRAAQTRLAGLQSQPSLARLFNFVVDVRFSYADFAKEARKSNNFKERRGVSGEARFGFVSAELKCRDAARRVWTTCKIKLKGEDAVNADFWPCTRVELDLFATLSGAEDKRKTRDDLIASGALSQVDGVVYIAAARRNGGDDLLEPRFDIISLDAAQAVENRQTVAVGAKPGASPLLTLRTAGLAVVDRWRETSALMQALGSLSRDKTPASQVIDADDLTVGYRMDVAVKSGKHLTWRSLCNRWVRFGDNLNHIEPLLQRVVQRFDDRLAYDSAIVVTPAKIQPARGNVGPATAYVDDTVGHWTGPPIGVDANSHDIDLTTGTNKQALQLGQCVSLGPDPDKPEIIPDDAKIPRQLFGGGYHHGLTPRFVGGIIRSLRDGGVYLPVSPDSDKLSESEKYFAVLPCPTTGPRRFLRHERIEAPIVATPLPILDRVFDGVVDGLRESAETITVRSKPAGGESKAYVPLDQHNGKPVTSSYRVIVPPSVSAEFADRHNVFDDDKELLPYVDHNKHEWRGPPDGLADIDYDQPAGGFPTYGYSATSRGKLEPATDPRIKPSGDAVFRPRASGTRPPRRDPYYPDPAAHYIVVAVRDLAGQLLPGAPLIVPVQPTGGYPTIRPVALDVVAMTARSRKPASQERILGLQSTRPDGYLTGADAIGKPNAVATVRLDGNDTIGSGSIEASRVRVALEPGESYEIDMWCLPRDDKQLASWFDAVESAALVASVDRATGRTCISCDEFALRLQALKLDQLTDFVTRLGLSRAAANSPICGPAQSTVPAGALRCIAEVAYRLLQSRPTPELAARKTVTVTHAIAQPFAKPQSELSLLRLAADTKAGDAVDDKQAVVIDGIVRVDRPTTGLFEIRAEGASLVTNAFDDDQRRRRTSDEVARGIWPRSPVTDDLMTVSDVYGFSVDSKGCVTLANEQATLLRVDEDIEAPDPGVPGMADRDIAVLRQAIHANANGGNTVRINAPFTITDSRARILKIWAVAGSRTAGCFRDQKGDVWESALASEASKPQSLVVQATKAPAKVAPITILPAFHLKQLHLHDGTIRKFTVERRIRLRIRMRRPWYSSGEGERLGIVLWPPDILNERIAPSGASVARDYDTGAGEKADIAMAGFADEDLGPGGDFVTRWGLDPTKGSGELGWLVPPTAFADLAGAAVDDGTSNPDLSQGPVYVPRASIPIPVDDGSGNRRQTSLEAALLTYVPRFDVDHENWFCDVELKVGTAPEPFIRLGLVRYQPFAPAALRVSEPIVEWAQVPQDRLVVVSIDTANPKLVEVVACGSGSTHGAPAPWGYDPGRIESLVQRPMMKVTVMKRRPDGVNEVARLDAKSSVCRVGYSRRAERVWLPLTQAEWEHRLTLPTSWEPPRPQLAVGADPPGRTTTLYWRAEFHLDDKPLDPEVVETEYSVLIEEVQPMLPATFADEPTESAASSPSKDRQALAISGPRFAALVELAEKGSSTPKAAPVPAASVVAKPPKKRRIVVPRRRPVPAGPASGP